MIKKIFARIWALWGIISFIATFLIICWPSFATKLISNPKGIHWFIKIAKWWMKSWLYLVGCPIKVVGVSNFKKGETYIVTANHNALLDVPMLCPFIPGANQTIAKDSFTKVPIFGWYYARGSVLVNRKSIVSRKKSYDLMKAALKNTFHMAVFPEGTRNKSNQPIAAFHDGAFKLAVDTGNSIIPTVILNTKKAMPVTEFFYLFPHKVEMHFLPAVEVANKTAQQLKDEIHAIMTAYYNAHFKA
jgi:1-acyl-sn-glycerol-3-phosphate acyltransferase